MTKSINTKALADARSVAYGLYRMNALGADRYGFTLTPDGNAVDYGEFLWPSDTNSRVDWVLDFSTDEVRNVENER